MNNNLVETAQEVLRGTRYYQAEAANGDATEENFELDYILINRSMSKAESVLAYAHFQGRFIALTHAGFEVRCGNLRLGLFFLSGSVLASGGWL